MKRTHVAEDDNVFIKKEDPTKDEIMNLNVGGVIIKTSLYTLTSIYPDSVLARVFGNDKIPLDDNGYYFIDTDGKLFSHILQYIRRKISFNIIPVDITKEVWYKELDYWGLKYEIDTDNNKPDYLKEYYGLNTKTKTTTTPTTTPTPISIPAPTPENKYTTTLKTQIQNHISIREDRLNKTMLYLLETTGTNNKIQNGITDLYIHIPFDGYKTTWGESLIDYILHSRSYFESFFSRDKAQTNGMIYIYRIDYASQAKTRAVEYIFDSKTYNTVDTKTLCISMSIRL